MGIISDTIELTEGNYIEFLTPYVNTKEKSVHPKLSQKEVEFNFKFDFQTFQEVPIFSTAR
jgi:hypothetical protein